MKVSSLLKFLVPVLFLLFLGCSSDDSQNTTVDILKINVDGTSYNVSNENVVANENCEMIFINTQYYDKNNILFGLNIDISKEGKLVKVEYRENSDFATSSTVNYFRTPYYNPLSTFSVDNFYYSSSTGELKFKFAGTLFLENISGESRLLEGEINLKTLQSLPCQAPILGLNFESETISLFSNNPTAYTNSTGVQKHEFFCNNGYFITILLSGDLWDYNFGEYNFSENDILNKVEFKEALAPLMFGELNAGSQQWKTYQTSGKIIVENKYTEHNQKVVSGKLNLEIRENGQLIHTLNGIEFRTYSLVDL